MLKNLKNLINEFGDPDVLIKLVTHAKSYVLLNILTY